MLIDNCDRVREHLGGTVSILPQLRLVVAQLVEQAFAKVSACDARRIQLTHNLNRFVQVFAIKAGREDVSVGLNYRRLG